MQPTVNSTMAALAENGGPGLFVLAVAVTDSVPFAPTQPVSILAGAIFGLGLGLPAVITGQMLATTFAMCFGRFILASKCQERATINTELESLLLTSVEEGEEMTETNTRTASARNRKLAQILAEMTSGLNSNDWKIVFYTVLLARQSPVIPFSLGNYFVGASTTAPLLPALVATVIGCLPLNLLWVSAGAGSVAAFKAFDLEGIFAEVLAFVGLLATAIILICLVKSVLVAWNNDHGEYETIR